jgi:hypothetical protein
MLNSSDIKNIFYSRLQALGQAVGGMMPELRADAGVVAILKELFDYFIRAKGAAKRAYIFLLSLLYAVDEVIYLRRVLFAPKKIP